MQAFPLFVGRVKPTGGRLQLVAFFSRLDRVVHLVGRNPFLIDDRIQAAESRHDRRSVLVDSRDPVLVIPASPLKIGADQGAKQTGRRNEPDKRAEDRSRSGLDRASCRIGFGRCSAPGILSFWLSHTWILDRTEFSIPRAGASCPSLVRIRKQARGRSGASSRLIIATIRASAHGSWRRAERTKKLRLGAPQQQPRNRPLPTA
jgi:hypothetical protein